MPERDVPGADELGEEPEYTAGPTRVIRAKARIVRVDGSRPPAHPACLVPPVGARLAAVLNRGAREGRRSA